MKADVTRQRCLKWVGGKLQVVGTAPQCAEQQPCDSFHPCLMRHTDSIAAGKVINRPQVK